MGVDLPGGEGVAALFMVALSVAVAVFWMIVAWRAMLAHEKLAAATKRIADQQSTQGQAS